MSKRKRLWIVGQAPARSGDGRPFTGPSGDRLVRLMGLDSYDEMTDLFQLDNLITEKQMRKIGDRAGDQFDKRLGLAGAQRIINRLPMDFILIACGNRVVDRFRVATGSRGWGLEKLEYFQYKIWIPQTIGHIILIPHPSGANRYWNDPENVDRASESLRSLGQLARSLTRDASSTPSETASGSRVEHSRRT